MNETIRRFMTVSPHTIGQEQSLEKAHSLMRQHAIRHLPVLEGGKLIGVLSQRDLLLIETLSEVDPHTTAVSEAMSQNVYCAAPTASLFGVAREMAEHRYGSAVIVEGGHVVGVFTTTDALRALASFDSAQFDAPSL